MVSIQNLEPVKDSTLNELGLYWVKETDCAIDKLIEVTTEEAEAYYEAANELYDMYVDAAEYIIDNDLFFELGIPFNIVDTIKKSWENDVHWHIYGAFKFAGGVAGKPIKLAGFDADTTSHIFEAAQLQWAILQENDIDESQQFNEIYEKISENFKRLITLDDGIDLFDERYDGWNILFSSLSNTKDESTTRLLQQMADEAGFSNEFSYLDDVLFDDESICDKHSNKFEYWYKHKKWLDIATDESELATTLATIMKNQEAIIINPAYTLLFESRGMLKILKDLYPDSPYLLDVSFDKKDGYIEKTVFGDTSEYNNFKKIYQEIAPTLKDVHNSNYEAKVFFAYEACGLSFIKDNNDFVGHVMV